MSSVSLWRSLRRLGGLANLRGARIPHQQRPSQSAAPVAGETPAQRVAWLEQTLSEYIDTLGAQHPRSIAARNNLATKYAQTGRRQAAIEQFEQALDDAVASLGEEDQQTDVIRENLACCYEDARRFESAAEQWERLLQHRLQRLGATARETVNARASLATAYRKTGQYTAAAAHFERAIDESEVMSAEEGETLRIGLALTLRDAGRLEETIQQLRMVVSQRRHRLGGDHYETLVASHQLGRGYLQARRAVEAITTLERTYRSALATAGDPEVRILLMRVRRDLARAYSSVGRHRDAAALY